MLRRKKDYLRGEPLVVSRDFCVAFRDNYPYNFVAACQICNGIKSNLMFVSVDAARVYIQSLWEAREVEAEDERTVGGPSSHAD